MSDLLVESFPLDDLHPYHRNPRRGDVAGIAASLRKRGQYRPIVVNVGSKTGRPMEILAGNHTWAAARTLGWSEIQATTVDVGDDEAAQIVLADNRLADLGTYDDEDLAAVLASVSDLTGTGFEDAELEALLTAGEDPVSLNDADFVPAAPATSVTETGQVWHLGRSRLVVGSSTDTGLVASAMPDGQLADCVWTDPPYGVNYVGRTHDALTIKNDRPEEALSVLREAFAGIRQLVRPGGPVYVAHADSLRVGFQEVLEASGIRWRQTLVWIKDRFVLGHSDYQIQSEPICLGEVADEDWQPIAYGFAPGGEGRLGRGSAHWFGDNKQTNVFQVKRPSASRLHPTMKPVELVEQMITNSCPRGGVVLDLFAGSGSTLIAAYRQRMRAVVVELDPKYADIICRRWQEHTGIQPILRSTGKPHDFTPAD